MNTSELELIRGAVQKSVLSWLATSDNNFQPNVSPKEVFDLFEDQYIIIANIASPQSVRNIRENKNVCLSLIDVFVQKGLQIKAKAEIVEQGNREFERMKTCLENITKGKYPFNNIIRITPLKIKEIIAPNYLLNSDVTESEQIREAIKTYQVKDLINKYDL